MATFLQLSQLAAAVYGDVPPPDGWTRIDSGGAGRFGFQAAAYKGEGQTVVAFRGTTASAGDAAADLMLGAGMNTSHYAQADDFVQDYLAADGLVLCGHSLGGAIAQIVGNRSQMKFATFNAPGVAVLASRNILSANGAMFGLRLGGAVLSAVARPVQAAKDVRATFRVAQGVNICLTFDVVSRTGVHYGKVVRIPGTDANPVHQHSIATVVKVLETNPVGKLGIDHYFPSA